MNEARERPILFSGPMVLAILAGRKTQTRRILKRGVVEPLLSLTHMEGNNQVGILCGDPPRITDWCPYGGPGDRLWVREAWREAENGTYAYAADLSTYEPGALIDMPKLRWRPSIHMPRPASRITLNVTEVRVERLQDISEEDARAEGAEMLDCTYHGQCNSNRCPRHGVLDPYRVAFRHLWENLHGPGSWDLNPYVWRICFSRIDP